MEIKVKEHIFTLDDEDADLLQKPLDMYKNYLRSRRVFVARLIMQRLFKLTNSEMTKLEVHYKNKDKSDLRRDNLRLMKKGSTYVNWNSGTFGW